MLTIQIDPSNLTIWQEGAHAPIVFPQVAILNERDEVVEIGETLASFAARNPEWGHQNASTRDSSILALVEAAPQQAARLLCMAVMMALAKTGKRKWTIFKPVAKIELQWPEYTRLDSQTQAWFAYSLHINHFLRVNSLTINGETQDSKTIYAADTTFQLGGKGAILAGGCCVLYLILTFPPTTLTFEATLWNLVVILGIAGGIILLTIYPPVLAFSVIWKWYWQKSLWDSISKVIMISMERKLGVPRFWVDFLYRGSKDEWQKGK